MQMNGFVVINKPAEMSSNDAVVLVRGILRKFFGEKQKVGHLGTLDPMATGVLVVAIGKCTRLFDYLLDKKKTYRATFKFGVETDTLDVWGNNISSGGRVPSADEIKSVIPSLIGEVMQVPPIYSAKSVNGKRAYEYARKGVDIQLAPKKINIYDIKLLGGVDDEYSFEIVCGGGTYIRSIARDMATALGTTACMSALERTSSGDFDLKNAVTIRDFEADPQKYLLPVDVALQSMPSIDLPEEYADRILNGIKYQIETPQSPFAVKRNGHIIGVGVNHDKYLSIKVRLL